VNLLLLSNSTLPGKAYLEHAVAALRGHVSTTEPLAFVPYALADHAGYTAQVAKTFASIGVCVVGVHEGPDPSSVVAEAGAVFVGGGNTFRLLKRLQSEGLLDAIRQRVREGMPYVGSSAGTNVACPTIRTTNDMPIVAPQSFDSLGLVPFQINAHYLDPDPGSLHMGESREKRLTEFHEENSVPVLAMREGAWLSVDDSSAVLGGVSSSRLFRKGLEAEELPVGADVSHLLLE
jgi:dipeptidase E